MRMKVTIKISYFNDSDGSRVENYIVDHPWDNRMFYKCGFHRDDFDWYQYSNTSCFFGRHVEDSAITAFVVIGR